MGAVKFVEELPPSLSRNVVDNSEAVKELRARPGEWALVFEGAANTLAAAINAGKRASFQPKEHFEAVTRNNRHVEGRKAHRADIYVRYIGPTA